MVIGRRLLFVFPLATVACAQVLGLGDYRDDDARGADGGEAGGEAGVAACVDLANDCTPAAPAGWQGPVALYEAASAPPDCTAPYATLAIDAKADLAAPPAAQCACRCDPPSGATCSSAAVTAYSTGSCSNPCASDSLAPNGCLSVGACPGGSPKGMTIGDSTGVGSPSCAPQVTKVVPPASWGKQIRVCAAPNVGRGGCSGDAVCVGRPSLPFLPKHCVTTLGDAACPAGRYSEKHLAYRGLADTRGCAACTCGAVEGFSCGGAGKIRLFSDTTCSDAAKLVDAFDVPTAACITTASIPATTRGVKFVPSASGSCPPAGGAPAGSATPSEPVTICCVP